MLPRLDLNEGERLRAVQILVECLDDWSKIVKTLSMQALADLALVDPRFRLKVMALLQKLVQIGSPAMQSRGRKLLAVLKEET